MWIVITAIGVIALVIFLGVRAMSAPPSRPDPDKQPETERTDVDELPHVGDHTSPKRSDGSPVPGSEEDRNRHGQK